MSNWTIDVMLTKEDANVLLRSLAKINDIDQREMDEIPTFETHRGEHTLPAEAHELKSEMHRRTHIVKRVLYKMIEADPSLAATYSGEKSTDE